MAVLAVVPGLRIRAHQRAPRGHAALPALPESRHRRPRLRAQSPCAATSHRRDRREDVRVSDDSDDRDLMYYEVATPSTSTPDLAPGAWRHTGRAFGVDFARNAAIRQFNLGRQRFDVCRRDRSRGTGRITGFGVCTDMWLRERRTIPAARCSAHRQTASIASTPIVHGAREARPGGLVPTSESCSSTN